MRQAHSVALLNNAPANRDFPTDVGTPVGKPASQPAGKLATCTYSRAQLAALTRTTRARNTIQLIQFNHATKRSMNANGHSNIILFTKIFTSACKNARLNTNTNICMLAT